MEFLKEIFSGGALTYEQLAEAVQEKGIELADLATGAYAPQDRLTALETERDALKTQLTDANQAIKGFETLDVESIKAKAAEWESKYNADTQALRDQLAQTEYSFAVKEAANGLQFTSESARRAFLSDLTAQKLPLQDGKLLGMEDYVKGYQKNDPGAFQPAGELPRLVTGGGAMPALADITREQYHKMPYSERLKLKTERPELYQSLAGAE